MTTASKITIARVLLIPLFMWLALVGQQMPALIVFVLASATDWVDGYVARKYKQISDFGKFIDPLADKLLVVSAMLLFVQWGRMPAWALMIVLTREFAISGVRMLAATKGQVIAAGLSGKIKTAVTMLGLVLMLSPLYARVLFASVTIDQIVILCILLTTLYSGIEYLLKSKHILFES